MAAGVGPHRTPPGGIAVARHIDVAAPVHGDGAAIIKIDPAQEGVPGQPAGRVQSGGEGISVAGVSPHRSAPGDTAPACRVDVPAPVHRDAESFIVPVPAQEGVPGQPTGRVQFGGEGIEETGVGPHRTAPSGSAVARHVDVPTPIHSHGVAKVVPTPAQEGVPGQPTGRVQFGGEGIAACGISPHRTPPGGIAVARHIDVAAPVHGDGQAFIVPAPAQEGVPDQARIYHQGMPRVIRSDREGHFLPMYSEGYLHRHAPAVDLLPGDGRAFAQCAGLESNPQPAILIQCKRRVVSQPDTPRIRLGCNRVGGGVDAPGCSSVRQADPLP